jgi:EAL domain-containing protein (putative c-di-GMP-specific phosphodiesterase class I)
MRTCRLRSDLWKALDRNELLLHYQPLISLRRGHVAGGEALLRWRHPGGEIIPPLQFIPIAEETGLIGPIGEWVLRTACEQNAAWQKAGLPAVPVAVNLSVHQLRQPNFCRMVTRVLTETGLPPDCLELELTETTLMDNLDVALAVMEQLTAMGVKLSIDDFGTGYSSLGYLKQLPCDKLKIDRSFVADLTTDAKSAAIVGGLINLAHNLDLQVTAEGVELEEQLSFLRAAGCDQMQGHLVSPPVEAQTFADLLGSQFNLYPAPSMARDGR